MPTGEPETIMLVPTGGLEHALLVDLEGRWISWEFLWNGGDCHETVAACLENVAMCNLTMVSEKNGLLVCK